MQTKTKTVTFPNNTSAIDYAKTHKGVFINILSLCGRSPSTGKYEFRYILSNKNLTGEKVKFEYNGNNVESVVVYSCLGTDYRDVKKYRDEFRKATMRLLEDYKKQEKLDRHIHGENYSLKELRNKGYLDEE